MKARMALEFGDTDEMPHPEELFWPRVGFSMPEVQRLAALIERGAWDVAWALRQALGWDDKKKQIHDKWLHFRIHGNIPMEATDHEMLLGEADVASEGPEEVFRRSMPTTLPTLYPRGRDMRRVLAGVPAGPARKSSGRMRPGTQNPRQDPAAVCG